MHLNREFTVFSPVPTADRRAAVQLRNRAFLCAFLLLMLLFTAPVWAQKPGTPTIAVPTTFAGISVNSNNHSYPPSGTNFGLLRLWDTPGTSWPDLQASATSSLTTTDLDTLLEDACENSPGYVSNTTCGDAVVMFTFGRVPYWATSNQSDTTCAYYNSSEWNPTTHTPLTAAPGQCDPPSDLNAEGYGTDAYWRTFVTDLATHLTGLSSTQYAKVIYFEPWNEIDRGSLLDGDGSNVSYGGTYAQLLRMTEDMRCIFLGTGTIHNYPAQGSSTACSSTTWSGQSVGIYTSAKIVSPSSHAQGSNYLTATSVEKNFLHCDATGSHAPPVDTYCNWGTGTNAWGAQAVDIINFHMKPGNEPQTFSNSSPNTDPETEMATEYSNATAVIESGDPTTLWNGESGYSGSSPCGWTPSSSGDVDLNSYPGQQAAFLARYFLVMWSLGIQSNSWYQYDNSNFLEGDCSGGVYTSNGTTTDAYTAYNTLATWMNGNTMSTGCAASTTYTDQQGSKTLWSCTFTNGSWTGEVFWDSNPHYACEGTNPCNNFYWYTVATSFVDYQTAIGSLTTIPTSGSNANQIKISNMPTIVVTGAIPHQR